MRPHHAYIEYRKLGIESSLDTLKKFSAFKQLIYTSFMGLVNRIKRSSFLKQNLIFFIGSVAVGFLNYIYYPVISRTLTPESFGEVQTLISIFLQLTIFLNVLSMVIVTIVVNYQDEDAKNHAVIELEKFALILGLLFLLITAAIAPQLQLAFKFDSMLPFIVLALALVFSVPFNFRTAYLRGKKSFIQASIANILNAFLKLILSLFFIILGWKTLGAVFGIALAQLMALAYAGVYVKKHGLNINPKKYLKFPDLKNISTELKYSLTIFIAMFIITVQFSADIVLIKYFFDAQTAGLYAGISTIARIIFFLTAPLIQVLLSVVKREQTNNQNLKFLKKTLALFLAIGGTTLAILCLAPTKVTHLLVGDEYSSYIHMLPKLALMVFIVSAINLLSSYFLALKRNSVVFILLLGSVTTFTLIFFGIKDLETITNNLLYGSLVMVALLMFWTFIQKSKQTNENF